MDFNPQEYYENLNPQQYKAVFNDKQYMCLLAIPGSGKTFTLIGKIIHLIESEKVYSHEITAITFTNKAAKELRERVNKYIGEVEGETVTIGTFHSLCVKILIRHGSYIGIDKFSILDDKASKKKMKKFAIEVLGKVAFEKNYKLKDIKSQISNWKKDLYSPKKAFETANSNKDKQMAKIYNRYYKECVEENNLDFDDLIVKTVMLLGRNKQIRDRVTRDIKFLLVDESQDTNKIQFKLIKLLLTDETMLFMVADDDQSIYGFRGAEPRYILNFKRLFDDGVILKLEQNYRSTKTIVEAADHVISNNFNRQEKHAFTENEVGEKIIVNQLEDAYKESIFVKDEIKKLVEIDGYDYKDIAILYRSNAQSAKLETDLTNAHIPYHLIGSTSFYGRVEIKDLTAYFKLLVNHKDKESLKRILATQSGIGKKSIERLFDFQKENNLTCIGAIQRYNKKPRIVSRLKILKVFFTKIIEEKIEDPEEILRMILEDCGYRKYLQNKYSEKFKERMENVNELFDLILNYKENNEKQFRSLQDFTSTISLSTETTEVPDTLKLLTVHSAKGLEFPVVFIIGVEEQLMPYRLASTPSAIEEERRLFYVGMTRAEKKLYLTYTKFRSRFGGKPKRVEQSRFLSNIPSKYLKKPDENDIIDDFEFSTKQATFAL